MVQGSYLSVVVVLGMCGAGCASAPLSQPVGDSGGASTHRAGRVGPEPLGTAVGFPARWKGPCRTHATLRTGPATLVFEYERTEACTVPVAVIASQSVFGCPRSSRFSDDAPDRRQLYTYDARGRMTSDGIRTFHWEGTTVVAIEANGRRGAVTIHGRDVRHDLGSASVIVHLGDDGFPAREEVLESNGTLQRKASLRYGEHGRLLRTDADDLAVTVDYCD